MAKLVLMSAVIAAIIIPVATSRDRSARRGLVRAVRGVLLFNVLYAVLLSLVYLRIAPK